MEAKTNGKVIEYEMVIKNQRGFHLRPLAEFVKTVEKFLAEITVTKDSASVNGKSIVGLMLLEAARGTKLIIRAEGDDANEAVDAIQTLIEDKDSKFNKA